MNIARLNIRTGILHILLWSSFLAWSQAPSLKQLEDSLVSCAKQILALREDSAKLKVNEQYMSLMKQALQQEGSFDYTFDEVRSMATLEAPDKSFKIYNWHIKTTDTRYRYYALMQCKKKSGSPMVYELNDQSDSIENPETAKLTGERWYGVHYYSIVGMNSKNKSYILLGWDGNYWTTQKKVIESLSFNSKGMPLFGHVPIKWDNANKSRVIFEYSAQTTMSLRYDKRLKMIVFDNLAPLTPNLKGAYQYYGPDMTYGGLELVKGKWEYHKDINPFNQDGTNKPVEPKYSRTRLESENEKTEKEDVDD